MLETNWQVAAWQGCCIEIRGDLCKLFSRMNLFEFDLKTTTFGCGYGYISNKQQNTLVQIMKFCSKCDMLYKQALALFFFTKNSQLKKYCLNF